MTLSEEIKSKIRAEYESWVDSHYGDITPERRKDLGMVFTPPDITIQMIEMLDCDTLEKKDILDPACGCGGLLAACIIAGADPKRVYGNEFEPSMVELCRSRLAEHGVPEHNIHQGDATDPYCLKNFGPDYRWPRQTTVQLF